MELNLPKVSIITCTYNGEKYISKLFYSVLNMGYPNIEHIVINDGSTDNTEAIIQKYIELYKASNQNLEIKYIKQTNMGLGASTNVGLRNITGEYWTWINCDDWYNGNFIGECLKVFNKSKRNIDVVFTNGEYYINEIERFPLFKKNANRKLFKNKKTLLRATMYNIDSWRQGLYLVKTSSYKHVVPSMRISPSRYVQDIQFINQIVPFMSAGYVNKVLFSLYCHKGQLSGSLFNNKEMYDEVDKAVAAQQGYINKEIDVSDINFESSVKFSLLNKSWKCFRFKEYKEMKSLIKLYNEKVKHHKYVDKSYKHLITTKYKIKYLLMSFVSIFLG